MSPVAALVVWTAIGALAVRSLVRWWSPGRPSVHDVVAGLRGWPEEPEPAVGAIERLGATVSRAELVRGRLPQAVELRLARTTAPEYAGRLVAAAATGLLAPVLLVGLARWTGVAAPGAAVPLAVAAASAVAAPGLVHLSFVERVRVERTDLRHQLSAYLDVVTMLLAGNTGHEGALEQAAHAGDGRLFAELRRGMREAATSGDSLVVALATTGADLGLVELEQVAAAAALSSAEGAPVVRTLTARCASLRSTLASEQEAEARLRTSRLTAPLVGMALIFMALVIYPALHLS